MSFSTKMLARWLYLTLDSRSFINEKGDLFHISSLPAISVSLISVQIDELNNLVSPNAAGHFNEKIT